MRANRKHYFNFEFFRELNKSLPFKQIGLRNFVPPPQVFEQLSHGPQFFQLNGKIGPFEPISN